jgi:hypothetical protein
MKGQLLITRQARYAHTAQSAPGRTPLADSRIACRRGQLGGRDRSHRKPPGERRPDRGPQRPAQHEPVASQSQGVSPGAPEPAAPPACGTNVRRPNHLRDGVLTAAAARLTGSAGVWRGRRPTPETGLTFSGGAGTASGCPRRAPSAAPGPGNVRAWAIRSIGGCLCTHARRSGAGNRRGTAMPAGTSIDRPTGSGRGSTPPKPSRASTPTRQASTYGRCAGLQRSRRISGIKSP